VSDNIDVHHSLFSSPLALMIIDMMISVNVHIVVSVLDKVRAEGVVLVVILVGFLTRYYSRNCTYGHPSSRQYILTN